MTSRARVQLAHGLEGTPQGAKARALGEAFELVCPAMPVPDFAACVALHERMLAEAPPDLLVGSSFGGAVAWQLLLTGAWRGPCVLLAPAVARMGLPWSLPEGRRAPIWLVHGLHDELLPWQDSLALSRASARQGLQLVLVEDDHRLGDWTAGGGLVELARRAAVEHS